MKRNAMNELKSWVQSEVKRPAILKGMKGVGKTYLSIDFAKAFFNEYIYINFETDARVREYIFNTLISESGNESIDIVDILRSYYEVGNSQKSLLFILDEIGLFPDIFKLFCAYAKKQNAVRQEQRINCSEEADYTILAVCSVCNLSFIDEAASVHIINLYPFSFDEFLLASGHEWYKEVIEAHFMTMKRVPDIVHNELLAYFDDYLSIGGMPSAINEYFLLDNTLNVTERNRIAYNNMLSEISAQYSEGEALKQHQILNIADTQLFMENKKFQYTYIRKGATYTMYKDAIDTLSDNSMMLKCYKSCVNDDNTLEYDEASFKLYYADVGLLFMKKQCSIKYAIADEDIYKKAILENYVAEALTSKRYKLYFWESGSQAKIDFLIEIDGRLIPIEAKSDEYRRSKSLSVFQKRFNTDYAIKYTYRNFEEHKGIKYIPYYAAFCT